MIQVNRIYLIFNRLVTKKFLVDTSDIGYKKKKRLAKSGKDKLILTGLVCVISHGILSPYHSFIPLRVKSYFLLNRYGVTRIKILFLQ